MWMAQCMEVYKMNKSGGIGFAGLLTIVFIVLKLMHVISWSWLWVLSPIWISAILFVALVFVTVFFTPDR